MKYLFLISIALLTFTKAISQDQKKSTELEVSFVDSTAIEINRTKSDQIISIPIKLNIISELDSLKNYNLEIKVDKEKTTLNPNDYTLISEKISLEKAKDLNELLLKIKKDSLTDRKRELYLNLIVSKNDSIIELNKGHQTLKIIVNPIAEELTGYEYLAYVGTNFDLVEGVKAKDLFFAANIYKAPKQVKGSVGFYLSIYGNRAFTQVDSTAIQRTTITANSLSDTTYARISTTNYILSKEVTDNLGTYISPLIKIKAFNPRREIKELNLYYSPSMEFVYRRTNITYENTGRFVKDSTVVRGDLDSAEIPSNIDPPLFGQVMNEFTFNFGIAALFMTLENKNMSVRIHSSVGYTSNYFREIVDNRKQTSLSQKGDVFFSGRAWITESTTGITLQAEVTNTLKEHRPFFVATLSKAFNFRDLGRIFQPITTK